MKILLLAMSVWLLHLQGVAQAAEPGNELDENVAKRLIAEVLEIREAGITVAVVVDGEKCSEDGFTEKQVRRVTAIHPILVDGRSVRRVQYYDFSWNQRFGWFYRKVESTRSGEEVRIWSEREGEQVFK